MNYSLDGITGITNDSRQVQRGNIFFAVSGKSADGASFIDEAIARGASLIIYQNDYRGITVSDSRVKFLAVDNVRLVMAEIADKFYPDKPTNIVAVTGTNGKSSVVSFCQQIWSSLGHRSVSVGTIGVVGDVQAAVNTGGLTTPDVIVIHKLLAELHLGKVDYVAIEASSHGIDQYRLDGLNFRAAAITNVSQDHLDYHGSMKNYLESKLRLFTDLLPVRGTAVLNSDIPEYEYIKHRVVSSGRSAIDYGRMAQDLRVNSIIGDIESQEIVFSYRGREYLFSSNIIGEFQAYNILCAIGLVLECGVEGKAAIEVIPHLKPVAGRMERVRAGSNVFVDYAHTPDALEKSIKLLRALCKGRLIVVFGCGGDRDKAKRSIMGKIASDLADVVIVTDDNPRTENPSEIRRQIISGAIDAIEIGDRDAAIKTAVSMMGSDDVVLIAGKGHEKYQIIGTQKINFDDVKCVREAL